MKHMIGMSKIVGRIFTNDHEIRLEEIGGQENGSRRSP